MADFATQCHPGDAMISYSQGQGNVWRACLQIIKPVGDTDGLGVCRGVRAANAVPGCPCGPVARHKRHICVEVDFICAVGDGFQQWPHTLQRNTQIGSLRLHFQVLLCLKMLSEHSTSSHLLLQDSAVRTQTGALEYLGCSVSQY